MTVKELIKMLRSFDEAHHVVVQDMHKGRDSECEIEEVVFHGYCIIKTITDK